MASPASKIEVRLSADQRDALERLVHTGTRAAHARRRVSIPLRADASGPHAWPDGRIAEALVIDRNTVWRVRAQFVAEGIDATLHEGKAEGRQYRKLDGAREARPVAPACSRPPDGQARWTPRPLPERLVELEAGEAVDPSTVWGTLEETS